MFAERRSSKTGGIDIPAPKRALITDRSVQRSIVRDSTKKADTTLFDGQARNHVQCPITNNKDDHHDLVHESTEGSIFEFDEEEDGSWSAYTGSNSASSECTQSKRLEWLARASCSETSISSNSQSLTSSKDSADADADGECICTTTETGLVPTAQHDGQACVPISRTSSNADVQSCDSRSTNGSPLALKSSWTVAGQVQQTRSQSIVELRSRSSSCSTWDSQAFSPPLNDIAGDQVDVLIKEESVHPQRITICADQFVVSAFKVLAAYFLHQPSRASHHSGNSVPEVVLVDETGVERETITFQVFINRFFEGICATSSVSAHILCCNQDELETLLSCLLVVGSIDADGHATLGYPAASRLNAQNYFHTLGQLLRLCHEQTEVYVPVTFGQDLLEHLCNTHKSKNVVGALAGNQPSETESASKRCKAMDLAHENLSAGFNGQRTASGLGWTQLHKSFAEPLTANACRSYIKRPSIGTSQSPASTDSYESQLILGLFDLYIDKLVDIDDQDVEKPASSVVRMESEIQAEAEVEAVPRLALDIGPSPTHADPDKSTSNSREDATLEEPSNNISRLSCLFDSIIRRFKAAAHNNASIIDTSAKKPLSPIRSRALTLPSAFAKAPTTSTPSATKSPHNTRNTSDVSAVCLSSKEPQSRTATIASKSRVDFLEDLLQTRILGTINRRLLDRHEAISVSVSKNDEMRDVRVIFNPTSPLSIDKRPRRTSEVNSEISFFDGKQGSTAKENCINKILPQLILPQAKTYDELLIALLLHLKTEQKHMIHDCPSSALNNYRQRKGFHPTRTLQY